MCFHVFISLWGGGDGIFAGSIDWLILFVMDEKLE
jgi:hypothetical protein